MSADSVDQVFEKAISTIHTLSSLKGYNSLPRPPANIRIELYALFKQSTEGDVDNILLQPEGDLSSPEYVVALKKWEAWKTKTGMSHTEAKKLYIQMLISTMRSYAMGTLAARELLADLEFLWSQVADQNGMESDENNSMILELQNDLQDTKSLRLRREIYETLFALNESKSGLSRFRSLGEYKKPHDIVPESRLSKLRRIVRYIASFLLRQLWTLTKKLLFHGLLTIAVLLAAKQPGLLSPMHLDLTSTAVRKREPRKGLCATSLALCRDGVGFVFSYLNRRMGLGFHQIYLYVT
ncbi:LAME_0G13652g1_1 [Lachancea meyersii CBS 8951]|uniref:LAME_0G13652g1_1 n=1 Tax=Lachancea meyersii CBS 8951 TaxID=1266667 RepID=A0A1G4KA32_9SACH|nr:LAME_0G13652g1_1 [Lachancea meyersii CBS 8951]